jgi:hypothetical protein
MSQIKKHLHQNDAEDLPVENPHPMFEFDTNKNQDGIIDALDGLFNFEGQGEDYEEQNFANRMKRKRKRKR